MLLTENMIEKWKLIRNQLVSRPENHVNRSYSNVYILKLDFTQFARMLIR